MRHWSRAKLARRCGKCGDKISVGAPMVTIIFAPEYAIPHPKVRCEKCAGVPKPDQIPEPEVVKAAVPMVKPMTHVSNFAPFDGRMAAVGRDPGEEG